MIKTMLVDDEYLIRELVKNTIDWSGNGFEIVCEAEDGEQALAMAEQEKPQLIVIDINIPFINGIDLAKTIKGRYPNTKMIILTGYSEFAYAKQAINAGVLDYILKPIDVREFTEALLRIKSQLEKEANQKLYIEKLESNVNNSLTVLRDEFLSTVVQEATDPHKIAETFGKLEIRLLDQPLICVILEIDDLQRRYPAQKDQKLWSYAVLNIAAEVLGEFTEDMAAFSSSSKDIAIILNAGTFSGRSLEEKLAAICVRIQDIISRYFDFTVTCGIGRVKPGYGGIKDAYAEAAGALAQKFYTGCSTVLTFRAETSEVSASPYGDTVSRIKNQFLIALRTQQADDAAALMKELCSGAKLGRYSKNSVSYMTAEMLNVISSFASEANLTDLIKSDILSLDQIRLYETIDEVQTYLCQICSKAIDALKNSSRSRNSGAVSRAVKFIDSNYTKDWLSPERVANALFLSPSYLSKIFKKETNLNIVQYIIEKRMNVAKSIMDTQSDLQIMDIASRVGYSDPFYFSKSFKKFFGISPSRYLSNKNPVSARGHRQSR